MLQARERGLETTIYRAALITGESSGGTSNPEDFLALFLGGCISLGAAPDLDWALDACPVDHLVEVLARRLGGAPGPAVLHLLNPHPRGFREAVLWLNLYGYQLELLPYEAWLSRLQQALESDPEQPLQQLRGFSRPAPKVRTCPSFSPKSGAKLRKAPRPAAGWTPPASPARRSTPPCSSGSPTGWSPPAIGHRRAG